MENNSRGNKQMQNTMHELSYGSNTHKKRFGLKEAVVSALIIGISLTSPLYIRLIVTLGLILHYGFPKIEPKQNIEPRTEYKPTYSLYAPEIISMLRNAEVAKRGK